MDRERGWRISLTKRKCRFRCNVCNLCSREADLRFGSMHPKNRFLSLSLPSCDGGGVGDGTQPFGVSRSTRAECIFFEMIITSETFCFVLSSLPFRFPFLLFIGSVHCAPLEPHCLERNAFVARLAVLVNAMGEERLLHIGWFRNIFRHGGGNMKKVVVTSIRIWCPPVYLNF